jgi:2-keto-3-deoxy-L-rhamnonate aldolase RhmA
MTATVSTQDIQPRRSRFRAAIARTDGPALGTWVKLPMMEGIELIALAGFDFVVIDLEHSPLDLQTAYRLIGTANHLGVAPIVRIPTLEAGIVQRILDAGAEGVMLPHVDSVEQARAAVQAVRFPPLGTRGVGATSRAGLWGAMARAEYLRYGQEEVVLIAQIESAAAAAAAGAIAAVDGVDALLIGAADPHRRAHRQGGQGRRRSRQTHRKRGRGDRRSGAGSGGRRIHVHPDEQ